MALDHTQQALEDEIRASQRQIEPHLRTLEAEYLRTCGKWYGDNPENPEVDEDPENGRQAWLRAFLAEVAGGIPQCVIEAQGNDWPEDKAWLLQEACNRLARQRSAGMRGFVNRTAVDFGFRSARGYIGLTRSKNQVTPFAADLDFDEFLSDSTVTKRESARWTAHRLAPDIDDLIEEAKKPGSPWNGEVLERVRQSMTRDTMSAKKVPSQVERRQVPYWVMWERGYDLDGYGEESGHFGTLHYVLDPSVTSLLRGPGAAEVGASVVRASEPWFGVDTGPHVFAAGFKIGSLPVELAPLVASAVQNGKLNEVARAIFTAISEYKRNGVVNGDSQAALLRAARNGELISLPQGSQISNMFGVIESGGPTAQMLTGFQMLMESAQRAHGGLYSNAGDVQSDATATAIQSAHIGYASTMGLYTSSYLDFLSQVFSGWSYWFDLSPDIVTDFGPLPPEIAQQLAARGVQLDPRNPVLSQVTGEVTPEAVRAHRNKSLSVDAFSVRSKNESTLQQDILAAQGLIQMVIALGPYAAAVNVQELQRAVSRSRGAKWIERLFDPMAIQAISVAQLGQGQEAQPASVGSKPGPQISLGTSSPMASPKKMEMAE